MNPSCKLNRRLTFILLILFAHLSFSFSKIKVSGQSEDIISGLSNFGNFPIGKIIKGKLYHDAQFGGCNTTDFSVASQGSELAIVLLTSESFKECSIKDRVLNVEKIGGAVALISLEGDLSDSDLKNYFLNNEIIPGANAASDYSNTIPSMVINNSKAAELLSLLNKGEDVNLKFDFSISKREVVDMQLMFTSGDSNIYNLINQIRAMSENHTSLGPIVNIIPSYINYKHPMFNETNPTFIDSNLEDCVCGGRYCLDETTKAKGREILLEDVRQKCVYDYSVKNNNQTMFFEYMTLFQRACINHEDVPIENIQKVFGLTCSEEIAKFVGVPEQYFESCMDHTFDPPGLGYSYGEMTTNSVLGEWKRPKKTYDNLLTSQALFDGKFFYDAKLSNWDNLHHAICKLSEKSFQMDECYRENEEDAGLGFWFFFWLVVILIVVSNIVYLLCKRVALKRLNDRLNQKDMIGEISNTVSKYDQLGA